MDKRSNKKEESESLYKINFLNKEIGERKRLMKSKNRESSVEDCTQKEEYIFFGDKSTNHQILLF